MHGVYGRVSAAHHAVRFHYDKPLLTIDAVTIDGIQVRMSDRLEKGFVLMTLSHNLLKILLEEVEMVRYGLKTDDTANVRLLTPDELGGSSDVVS